MSLTVGDGRPKPIGAAADNGDSRSPREERRDSTPRMSKPLNALAVLTLAIIAVTCQGNEPDLHHATLEWRGKTLTPVEVFEDRKARVVAGTFMLELDSAAVVARDVADHEVRWTAECKSAAGGLRWMGANDTVGYVLVFTREARERKTVELPSIKRLRLGDGQWLEDLRIPESGAQEALLGMLPGPDLTFVLSATLVNDKEWPNEARMKRYRVTAFNESSGSVEWTRSFEAEEEPRQTGPFLLSAVRPNEAVPGVRPLSVWGDKLIICSGSRQAILCLEQKSGKTAWSRERIWEYERGFIGPSVWSHYLSRHGVRPYSVQGAEPDAVDAKRSADFEQRWTCNIVGGPIIAAMPSEGGADARQPPDFFGRDRSWHAALYIAVGRSRADGDRNSYSSFLQDCLIYELNADGEVVGILNMPRMVIGSVAQSVEGGVVWACQNNAVVRLCGSGSATSSGSCMPGGPDMLIQASWYRDYSTTESCEWLTTGKSGDPVALGTKRGFRVLAGGFVHAAEKRVFLLPVSAFEYVNGTMETLLLRLPMTEEIEVPKTNVSTFGDDSHRTFGPYLLAVTGLRLEGDRLAITVGMEARSVELLFDLSAVKH